VLHRILGSLNLECGEVFVLFTKVCDNALLVVFRRCWPSIHAVVITGYYALTECSWHLQGRREPAHRFRTNFRVVCPWLCSVRIYRITAFYRPRIWLELLTVLWMMIQVYLWISTSKEHGSYLQRTQRVAHLLSWLRIGRYGSYSNNVRLWVHWNLGFINSWFLHHIST
jgi:hypothetical protein